MISCFLQLLPLPLIFSSAITNGIISALIFLSLTNQSKPT